MCTVHQFVRDCPIAHAWSRPSVLRQPRLLDLGKLLFVDLDFVRIAAQQLTTGPWPGNPWGTGNSWQGLPCLILATQETLPCPTVPPYPDSRLRTKLFMTIVIIFTLFLMCIVHVHVHQVFQSQPSTNFERRDETFLQLAICFFVLLNLSKQAWFWIAECAAWSLLPVA